MVDRVEPDVGRYFANCHKQFKRNPNRFILYLRDCLLPNNDGLKIVDYNVVRLEKRSLYTKIYISYRNDS